MQKQKTLEELSREVEEQIALLKANIKALILANELLGQQVKGKAKEARWN